MKNNDKDNNYDDYNYIDNYNAMITRPQLRKSYSAETK